MPVTQLPNGLTVRTYEPPPDDFDPITASDRLLLHHGYPQRPDAEREPDLHRLWERAVSRRPAYVVPEFRVNEGRSHGPRKQVSEDPVVPRTPTTYSSNNWSGSMVFPTDEYSYFTMITGSWKVPLPDAPFGAPDGSQYYAAQWVGLGGWVPSGSNNLVQVGTETDVSVSEAGTTPHIYAW